MLSSYIQTRGTPMAWASHCHPSQGGSARGSPHRKNLPTRDNFLAALSRDICTPSFFPPSAVVRDTPVDLVPRLFPNLRRRTPLACGRNTAGWSSRITWAC